MKEKVGIRQCTVYRDRALRSRLGLDSEYRDSALRSRQGLDSVYRDRS